MTHRRTGKGRAVVVEHEGDFPTEMMDWESVVLLPVAQELLDAVQSEVESEDEEGLD